MLVLQHFNLVKEPEMRRVAFAAAVLICSSSAASGNLTYTTFEKPCRIIDTRLSSAGLLVSGVDRDFVVKGTIGFETQGGVAGGCNVPADARAAVINFVAVNSEGVGNLRASAYPNPIPATGSIINYQSLVPALNIANGLNVPLCDPSAAACTSDVRIRPNGAGVHLVADVLGFLVTADRPPAPSMIASSTAQLSDSEVSQRDELVQRLIRSKETRGREFNPRLRSRLQEQLSGETLAQLEARLETGNITPMDVSETQRDLVYTTFQQPCRIIDTRLTAGGALASGAPRSFKVAGDTGFDLQGGVPGGCGVPIGATAAMINFVAVNAQGLGNLKGSAFPNPIPTVGNVINYQMLTPGLNVANGVMFPICDATAATCDADITLLANGAAVHVVADVMGYAMKYRLTCVAGSFDLNGLVGDGCEFTLKTDAIYVSVTDVAALDDASCGLGPSGTGPGHHPCASIGQGLARTVALAREQTLVADGLYEEAVTLINGRDLLGGHRPDTWERHETTSNTIISGVSSTGVHDRTVIATGISLPTIFEGFVVRGAQNDKPSGNSYAIYISGSSDVLTIRNNFIQAGRGGNGIIGPGGTPGSDGANGAGRTAANAATYDAKVASGSGFCSTSNNRNYPNGGLRTCGTDVVNGGNGGGNQCTLSTNLMELSGFDGSPGQPGEGAGGGAAGAGGDAGDDSRLESNGTLCIIPAASTFGQNGTNGSPGAAGPTAVVTGTNPAGSVFGGHWKADDPPHGVSGGSGGGGGGGGAGGGAYCLSCSEDKDRLGAHGGGGGGGGCGGGGGSAGTGGGGAFAIFIVGGAAPAVVDNFIVRGSGGSGGAGGVGTSGGIGGEGGLGGLALAAPLFCADAGGRGGDGGDGGPGSGGGGGLGGGSWGIYTSGIVGVPALCSDNAIAGGAAGVGGQGGPSPRNSGPDGANGTLGLCSFN